MTTPDAPIERLRALAEKATPRPWEVRIEREYGAFGVLLNRYVQGVRSMAHADLAGPKPDGRWVVRFDDDYGTDQEADADLIVAAVNALPDLIAAVEAARPVAATTDAVSHCDHDDVCDGNDRLVAYMVESEHMTVLRAALDKLYRPAGGEGAGDG